MDLKQKIKDLVVASRLLSNEKKQELINKLPNLNEKQSRNLLAALKREPNYIKAGLINSLQERLQEGGEKTVSDFEQLLRDAQKKILKKEEKASTRQDSSELVDLEEQLNSL